MAFTTKLHAQPQGQFFGVGCFWPSCVELNHTYSLVIVCHGSSRPLTGQTVFFFFFLLFPLTIKYLIYMTLYVAVKCFHFI